MVSIDKMQHKRFQKFLADRMPFRRITSAVLRLECSLDCLSAPTLWRYDVAV